MVSTTGSNLVTKLPPNATARPGETIELSIDPCQVHLFDPAGPSLRRRSAS